MIAPYYTITDHHIWKQQTQLSKDNYHWLTILISAKYSYFGKKTVLTCSHLFSVVQYVSSDDKLK